MDRLTKKTEQGNAFVECGISKHTTFTERDTAFGKQCVPYGDVYDGAVIDRLAAYEDTGFEPSEIKTAVMFWGENAAQAQAQLSTYRTAEEQGLLVRLPCKLETPIVRILEHCTHGEDCDEHCNDRDTGEPCERKQATGRCRVKLWERGFNYCDIGDVGKTVFLTREEAERALKGGE